MTDAAEATSSSIPESSKRRKDFSQVKQHRDYVCVHMCVCAQACVFTQDADCLDKTNSASLHPHIKAEPPLRDPAQLTHKTVQARNKQPNKHTHASTRTLTHIHNQIHKHLCKTHAHAHAHRHTNMFKCINLAFLRISKVIPKHYPPVSSASSWIQEKTQSQFNVLKIPQETTTAASNKKAQKDHF